MNTQDNLNATEQSSLESDSQTAFAFLRENFLTQIVTNLALGNLFLELLLIGRGELGTGKIV